MQRRTDLPVPGRTRNRQSPTRATQCERDPHEVFGLGQACISTAYRCRDFYATRWRRESHEGSTLRATLMRKIPAVASGCTWPSMRMVTESDLIATNCCHVRDLHGAPPIVRRPPGCDREMEACSRASGRHPGHVGRGGADIGSARARRDRSWLRMRGCARAKPRMARKSNNNERRRSALSPGRRRPNLDAKRRGAVTAGRRPGSGSIRR